MARSGAGCSVSVRTVPATSAKSQPQLRPPARVGKAVCDALILRFNLSEGVPACAKEIRSSPVSHPRAGDQ